MSAWARRVHAAVRAHSSLDSAAFDRDESAAVLRANHGGAPDGVCGRSDPQMCAWMPSLKSVGTHRVGASSRTRSRASRARWCGAINGVAGRGGICWRRLRGGEDGSCFGRMRARRGFHRAGQSRHRQPLPSVRGDPLAGHRTGPSESRSRCRVLGSFLQSLLQAEDGVKVVLAGRSRASQQAAVQLRPSLGPCDFVQCDATDERSLLAAISNCDVVVHCAGPFQRSRDPTSGEADSHAGQAPSLTMPRSL